MEILRDFLETVNGLIQLSFSFLPFFFGRFFVILQIADGCLLDAHPFPDWLFMVLDANEFQEVSTPFLVGIR